MTVIPLRPDLPALPRHMRHLRLDDRGYPVPYFVQWIDGNPDFRVVDTKKMAEAIHKNLCFVCGRPKGVYHSFVIGPMCTVNRVSAEPPSHRDCAHYAVQACPFLTRPLAKRNTHDLPEGRVDPAGVMIERNPGVTCIWTTRSYFLEQVSSGVLFSIGDPTLVEWFAQGRVATRAEVDAAISSGLPILQEMAEKEGEAAIAALERQVIRALRYLPEETPA